ncbi:hypothetical protein [Neptuniibacter sp. QD48_11]|uniref:hypothetical protein n=1 Tax=Neptuniibacter sp. QD48_11 TaxID=3398211 RepID=UPI0039F5CE70
MIINGKSVAEYLEALNDTVSETEKNFEHQNLGVEVELELPQVASDDPIVSAHGTCFIKFAVPKESNIIPDSLLTKLLCSIRNRIGSSFRS